jgi:hypothetical protein
VIVVFLLGTTYESLPHKLEQKHPRTINKLLKLATSHALSEEAIEVIFGRSSCKRKWEEALDRGSFNHHKWERRTRSGWRLTLSSLWSARMTNSPTRKL